MASERGINSLPFTASLPLINFTSALDGFGFFGSISHVKSKVKFANSPDAITVPGLSKWVGTAEAYYEKHGFQARVSYRYRSKFIGEVAGLSAAPTFRTAKPEGILDAQVGYEFQTGMLKGLSILGQVKNITDTPFVTYEAPDKKRVIDWRGPLAYENEVEGPYFKIGLYWTEAGPNPIVAYHDNYSRGHSFDEVDPSIAHGGDRG